MNETESYIAQAIQSAKEGNPNDMQDSLGAALSNKITDAINLKKIELAGQFFDQWNEEDENENGSEEEEEDNGKKKKKNPFAKKKNGDDDDEDEDEEEVDEDALDELSKKTLGKYVKGAARDIGDVEFSRGAGAADGMAKSSQVSMQKHRDKRLKGIGQATKKLGS